MRQVKAKWLKAVALRATAGMKDRQLVRLPNGCLVNHPDTTRGYYRMLKRRSK
jgi:hypothetical protein